MNKLIILNWINQMVFDLNLIRITIDLVVNFDKMLNIEIFIF